MATTKHGVFRSDLMSGTDVAADLVSVKYMGSGSTETAIDNGCVVKLDGLMTGEREVWKGVTPAANTALTDIAIIGTEEVMYDERKKNLDEFENEAGTIARGYIPRSRNIFAVTADALNIGSGVTPAVGYAVELMAGVKLNVVATATASATQVGEVIAIENAGRYTYYVIKIN